MASPGAMPRFCRSPLRRANWFERWDSYSTDRPRRRRRRGWLRYDRLRRSRVADLAADRIENAVDEVDGLFAGKLARQFERFVDRNGGRRFRVEHFESG